MTTYNKYVTRLKAECDALRLIILAISQGPQVKTEEDIDARIKAAEKAIEYLHRAKRELLYFKNRLASAKLGRHDLL